MKAESTILDTPARALQPDNLSRRPHGSLHIKVLGTCFAEAIPDAASGSNWVVSHYLMKSRSFDTVPDAAWADCDAILVQVTLRNILENATDPPDDYFFHVRNAYDYEAILATTTANLAAVLRKITDAVNGRRPVFFLAFSEPPQTFRGILANNRRASFYHLVRSLNDAMANFLEASGNAHYLEVNDLLHHCGGARISDAEVLHLAHVGFTHTPETRAFYLAILRRISDAVRILAGEDQVKLLITDLDNTLWMGVLAEEDEIIPHRHHGGWPLGYAEALLEFKRRGGLLAICSKNDLEPTCANFRTVWTHRIQLGDFCSVKINRLPKSENISRILAETRILPANVLFIDDDPREIEEVRRVFPEMRFLSGDPASWRSVIVHSPEMQVAAISTEAASRTAMVQSMARRESLAREMDRGQYLRSLRIVVTFDEITDPAHSKYERALELLNRTNQFNTTGRRWSNADLATLFARGAALLTLSAADVFGQNGLVALAIIDTGVILQLVMSCRVFGLGLETALLCRALENPLLRRDAAGRPAVVGILTDSGKNMACASFYRDHGFCAASSIPGHWEMTSAPTWPSWISLG